MRSLAHVSVSTSVSLLVLSLGLATPASASDEMDTFTAPGPEWSQASRNRDLVIFTKENKSAGVREIRAHTFVDAPPSAVFEAVSDFENYAKFMPYVKESEIIERAGDSLYVYSLLDLPLVSKRDYVIRVKPTRGNASNGGVFKSEWEGASEKRPVRDGVVRVTLNTGSWTLEPVDGGKRTRLTYSLLTHPGGAIPGWIANKSNTVAIPDLFKAVKKRSAENAKRARSASK